MRDQVKMVIGSTERATFLSYEADSNVLIPADVFYCAISRIETGIKSGQEFKLYVNDSLEMTGIIDKVAPSYEKGRQEMRIEGRDLMGLLVDSSVEEWKTLKGMKLKTLAERLFKAIPFIDKSKVIYETEKKDSGLSKKKKVKRETLKDIFSDTTSNACQYEAGVSIFEALSDYSQRHGLIFWMEPDGTFVFGELKGKADTPDFNFCLYKGSEDSYRNNIISGQLTDDISKRYSKVTVIAQIQGNDFLDAGGGEIRKTAKDKTFTFYKPLVLQSYCTSEKAASFQAQWELKKRDVEGWRLEYTVPGHSQNGQNYKANSVCSIKDEVLGLDGNYLILGRKFTMDRQNGPRTVLTIGKLMEGYTVE